MGDYTVTGAAPNSNQFRFRFRFRGSQSNQIKFYLHT